MSKRKGHAKQPLWREVKKAVCFKEGPPPHDYLKILCSGLKKKMFWEEI